MTPQERQLVVELFDRLATLEGSPRDPDAERAIAEGLARAPHAAYSLVQTALVQDEALKRAHARIEELEGPQQEPPQQGGFLDNMRDALFGRDERRGSVPNSRPGGLGSSGVWGPGAQAGAPPTSPQSAPPGYGSPPMGQPQVGSGGSFLGSAAASAAGVIGGAMLLNGIRSMFGHSASASAFDPGRGSGGGSPWGGSAANSDLARQAGIDDVGRDRGAARGEDSERSGFFGGSDHDDDHDEDDTGYDDTDDGDDGDDEVDYAGDYDDSDTA